MRYIIPEEKDEDNYWQIIDTLTDEKVLFHISLIQTRDMCKLLNQLNDKNETMKALVRGKVFKKYKEGSILDLQFKALAYDDIVNVEMDYDVEPKLIIYCKEGTKSDIERYARVKTFHIFIPFGVDYIIKEV